MSSISRLATLAALSFLIPIGVDGKGADEEDEASGRPTYEAEEIVVTGSRLFISESSSIATRLPVAITSVPASISAVGRATIEEQGSVILGDALANASGINVQTGFGVFDYFVIRGFDSLTSGLVLTDGIPEPEVSFYNLYNIESVEVLKGPGAFLYGGNPLSGTVNLVRKQPVFENFARIGGSVGSFGTYRATADIGAKNEKETVAFRLNGLLQGSDNYRDDKDNSTWAINPAVAWRIDERSTLRVQLEYVKASFKSDSGLPVVGDSLIAVPRKRSYQSPFDDSDLETYRLQLSFDRQLTDDISLRDRFYYTDFDWPSSGTIFNGVFPNTEGSQDLYRSLLVLDDHQRFIGNQLEAVMSRSTGSLRHTLLAGIEVARLSDEFTLDVAGLPNIALLSPVESAVRPLFIIPNQSTAADARSVVIAPYFVDQIDFGERYEAFVGARFDAIDYEDGITATDRTYNKLSPMLGLAFRPTADLSLYGNMSQAFAPPSSLVVGDRKAEESRQLEVGVKGKFAQGKVLGSLAFYELKKDNIAISVEKGVLKETGDQRSRGAELEVAAQLGPSLSTLLSYALSDAELTEFRDEVLVPTATGLDTTIIDRSGNTPAFAPTHILNLWSSLGVARGLSVSAGLRYVGDQYIDEDNLFQLESALTANAALHYELGTVSVRMHVDNLTGEKFETRGFGATSAIPADPFGARLSVEWSL